MKSIPFFLLFLFFVSCSPADTDKKACQSRSDCLEAQICAQNICVPRPENLSPVANAGSDRIVVLGKQVSLDGSLSADEDQDLLLFQWTIQKKPSTSQIVLDKANTSKATFLPDVVGEYVFVLAVSDKKSESRDEVTITVIRGENQAPIAVVGKDLVVEVGRKITLDGSQSYDPDGDTLRYQWSTVLPLGSKASLNDVNAEKPSFTPDVEGVYTFSLQVNDGQVDSRNSTFWVITATQGLDWEPQIVSVLPNKAPQGSDVEVRIQGKQFASQAQVFFQKQAVKTIFVTDSELKALLPLQSIQAGRFPITVKNPNKKESQELLFEVLEVKAPSIQSLVPSTAPAEWKIKVQVKGENFATTSKATFDAKEIPTRFVSEKELEIEIDCSQVAEGIYKVVVKTPKGSGTEDSVPAQFIVTKAPPLPELNQIFPTEAKQGDTLDLTLTGKEWMADAEVHMTGISPTDPKQAVVQVYPIRFVSSSEIVVEKLFWDPTQWGVGDVRIQVVLPSRKGLKTNEIVFVLKEAFPTPIILQLNPVFGYEGTTNQIEIIGTSFASNAKVFVDQVEQKKVSFLYSRSLSVEVDFTNSQAGKIHQITVQNPYSVGKEKTSVAYPLEVKKLPAPFIRKWVTSNLYMGVQATLLLEGEGFTPQSVVQWSDVGIRDGAPFYCLKLVDFTDIQTTYISPTQIQATVIVPSGITSANKFFGIRVKEGSQFSNAVCSEVSYQQTASKPLILSVQPSFATLGDSSPFALQIKGLNWDATSVVFFQSKPQKTVLSSQTKDVLEVELDIAGLQAGEYELLVTNGNGLSSSKVTFSLLAKGNPTLSSVSPQVFLSGTVNDFKLTGTGFTAQTKVYLGSTSFSGTLQYKSATELEVSQAKWILAEGTYNLYVEEKGKKSNTIPLSVQKNPTPELQSLNPDQGEEELFSGTIKVYGKNFMNDAIVYIAGVQQTCRKTSLNYLECKNMSFPGVKQGTYPVVVENPDGSKTTENISFTIVAPSPPKMTKLSPNTGTNNQSITLNVDGDNFHSSSVVWFDGKALLTTFVSAKKVTAVVDLNSFSAGAVIVKVKNTIQGVDYESNGLNFTVLQTPLPWVDWFSPMIALVGETVNVTLHGENFEATSKVYLNGMEQTITSQTSTTLRVTFDLKGITAGDLLFYVQTGSRKSEGIGFRVMSSYPMTVSSIVPQAVHQSTQSSTLKISGTNFDPLAKVLLNGQAIGAVVNSTFITFSLAFPDTQYTHNTKQIITIRNPDLSEVSVSFWVLDPSYPLLSHSYPTTLSSGKSVTLTLYGKNLDKTGMLWLAANSWLPGNGNSGSVSFSNFSLLGYGSNEFFFDVSGKKSNPFVLQVIEGSAPNLTKLTPPSGKKETTVSIRLNGTYFQSQSKVVFLGKEYAVQYVNASTLDVSLSLTGLNAGVYSLEVKNVDQQTSLSLPFTVH